MDLPAQDKAAGLHANGALGLSKDGDLAHVVGLVNWQHAAHGVEDGHHLVQHGASHVQQVEQELKLHRTQRTHTHNGQGTQAQKVSDTGTEGEWGGVVRQVDDTNMFVQA